MLAVQKLIQENKGNWREMLKDKNIEVKENAESGLILLKYLICADFTDPVVKECRGLILDADYNIVCYPFDKFGNYGEPYVDEIDWSSARVQEKIDGSIMKLYWYCGDWYVATNGTIFGEAIAPNGKMYRELFWRAAYNQGLDSDSLDRDYTYIFELVSPYAQIVIHYPETKIYHIGTRNNKTFKELNVDIGIEKPKEYPLYSLEDCITAAKELNGMEHEGYVVVDKNWHRVKVKLPEWIAAHHLCNNQNITATYLLKLMECGDLDEFLVYFPDYKEVAERMTQMMAAEAMEINIWVLLRKQDNLSRKDYALEYHTHPYFKFGIDYIYENKPIDIKLKYWEKFFEDKEIFN